MKRWSKATRRDSHRAHRAAGCLGLCLVGALGLAGCVTDRYPEAQARGAASAVAGLGGQIHLGEGMRAYYRVDGADAVTAVLVPDGARAEAGDYASMTVVRLMWRPKAGATPLNRTATNAVLRHLVFADQGPAPQAQDIAALDESLGLFTGAGFVKLSGDPEDGAVELAVREADLRLTDASAGYTHPLRRAALTARVQAIRNDAAVSRWLKASGVRASAALGYPASVRGPATPQGGLSISSGIGADRCIQPSPTPPSGA